ncbi:uncharacterized protein [Ptychodera flava]|uniref:uncharacterized protein n=1 Tax=Ptychodera flava TaxID=63121 RepID=UPI00396A2C53
MGSPVSPIVCNLYMELFESIALTTAPNPPSWWYRYVDDTHTKLERKFADEFTHHINNLDQHIKFTTEEEHDNALAFLDVETIRRPDGQIKTKVFGKSTHTDQYLHFTSNHPLVHKMGVVRTLHHRADLICSDPNDRLEEKTHINNALHHCGYPSLAIKQATRTRKKAHTNSVQRNINQKKVRVTAPYVKNLTEILQHIFRTYGMQLHAKPFNTIRQLLVCPKDPTPSKDVCGPIYHIRCEVCGDNEFKMDYIGETERYLQARVKEHVVQAVSLQMFLNSKFLNYSQ